MTLVQLIKLIIATYYNLMKLTRREYPLAILYYHHILEKPNVFNSSDICKKEFEEQITYLKGIFNIVTLQDAMQDLKYGRLKRNSLVITFDDGYKDNFDYAAPILEKHNAHATFFVATEGAKQAVLWNNVIEQSIIKTTKLTIPKMIIDEEIDISTLSLKIHAITLLMSVMKRMPNKERKQKIEQLSKHLEITTFDRITMNEEEIASLSAKGFEIGAHTHSHTILSAEHIDDCKKEIEMSKSILENITGKKIKYFAFPNGSFDTDFNSQHRNLIKKIGFEASFSTNDGGCFKDSNIFSLSRFMTIKKSLPLFALSIASIAHERSKSDERSSTKL